MEKFPSLRDCQLNLFGNSINLLIVQDPFARFLGRNTFQDATDALACALPLLETLPAETLATLQELHTTFSEGAKIAHNVALIETLRVSLAPYPIELYVYGGGRLYFEETNNEECLAVEALPAEAQPYLEALIAAGYQVVYTADISITL